MLGAGEQLAREKKPIVGYEQEADDEAGDKALFELSGRGELGFKVKGVIKLSRPALRHASHDAQSPIVPRCEATCTWSLFVKEIDVCSPASQLL